MFVNRGWFSDSCFFELFYDKDSIQAGLEQVQQVGWSVEKRSQSSRKNSARLMYNAIAKLLNDDVREAMKVQKTVLSNIKVIPRIFEPISDSSSGSDPLGNFLRCTIDLLKSFGEGLEVSTLVISKVALEALGVQPCHVKDASNGAINLAWDPKQDKNFRCILGVPYNIGSSDEGRILDDQRKKREGTDVTFLVGASLFSAHKSIISKNKYFSVLLGGNFCDGKDGNPIKIEEGSAECFEAFLSYLYTGEIALADKPVEFLVDLGQFADRMNDVDLQRLCRFYLIYAMSNETLLLIAEFADRTHDDMLFRACRLFLQKTKTDLRSIDLPPRISPNEIERCLFIVQKLGLTRFANQICRMQEDLKRKEPVGSFSQRVGEPHLKKPEKD